MRLCVYDMKIGGDLGKFFKQHSRIKSQQGQFNMSEIAVYLPEGVVDTGYKTKESVGYDICSVETVKIPSKTNRLVNTGIIIKIKQKNIFPAVFVRSSLPVKRNLIMLNSVGVIDLDYCGKEDSIKLNLYNIGEKEVVIEKGERIGQIVFLRFEKPDLKEVSDMEIFDENSRGGFGSTDN